MEKINMLHIRIGLHLMVINLNMFSKYFLGEPKRCEMFKVPHLLIPLILSGRSLGYYSTRAYLGKCSSRTDIYGRFKMDVTPVQVTISLNNYKKGRLKK